MTREAFEAWALAEIAKAPERPYPHDKRTREDLLKLAARAYDLGFDSCLDYVLGKIRQIKSPGVAAETGPPPGASSPPGHAAAPGQAGGPLSAAALHPEAESTEPGKP